MKKTILIVVLVLVALLAIGFLLINDDNNGGEQSERQTSSEEQAEQETPVFNVSSTESTSFVASMEGETIDGESYEGQIEHDGRGNFYYGGSSGEQTFEFYSIDDRSIFCSDGACFEGPSTTATLPFSQDQIDITDDEIADYRDNASFAGTQACNSGSCDAWEITSDEYTGTLLIDSSGRVDRASWEGPEGNFTINYSYEPVEINLPENIQNVPAV